MRSALLFLLGSFPLLASAQQEAPSPCGTDDPKRLIELHGNDPVRKARMQEAADALEERTRNFTPDAGRGGAYVIPMVFHIIHTNGAENISDEQVQDAIRVLNLDYNKLNTDWVNVQPEFQGLVADIGVEFKLATRDPDGNCTKGITRTVSALTNVGDSEMKGLINWPRNRYLNVWVCAYADGAAGYALYPSSVDGNGWGAAMDGIVVQHSYVGAIGTASVGRSRTLTHEVGHWLNLRHTWGDSNNPGLDSNCSTDDGVADTPNTKGWTTCSLQGASCGSAKDNVENFMEYSYCSKMFTQGQRTRLLAALTSSTAQRNNLWSTANLQLTGTLSEPGLCAADFTSDRRVICAGDSIGFIDQSYHSANAWSWSFPGGEPATANVETPEVRYAQPGTYPVTLTVSDGVNSEEVVVQNYITVLPDAGAALPLVEGFETSTTWPEEEWTVVDQQANGTFDRTSLASFSGTRSLRLANYGATAGSVDEVISTTYDLSNLAASPVLSFRYAFAKRSSSGGNDRLFVYVSKDCGKTWAVRGLLQAAGELVSAPVHGIPFTPSGPEEWKYMEISNISETYFSSSFRLKFTFVSDGGNNLWLDDINLNGQAVGLSEADDIGNAFMVMPNPSAGETWLVGDIGRVEHLAVDMLDATGRVVEQVGRINGGQGPQRIALPTEALARGVYFVRVQADGRRGMVRFVRE